ncbi:Xylulose kinase [Balamuthia mandrillaris]
MFLGLDCSTQGLKATLINDKLALVAEHAVHFDQDLPHFRTQGGVHRSADGSDNTVVTAPALLWCEALDLLLTRMREEQRVDFGRVRALSGSGQQHGSVYWRRGAREQALAQLRGEGERERAEESPVWMDSSTTRQCRALEERLGGAQRVADLTGSRAYERFTGLDGLFIFCQPIAKIIETQPSAYEATERISLVSSLIATLFLGSYAPIDHSDGSGMNLMDISTKEWSEEAIAATEGPTARGTLREKLGPLTPCHAVLGRVCSYFVKRYGFHPDCCVVAFSGDNPNSVAGMRLEKEGDVAISLGTSDTVFGILKEPHPSEHEGHVFCSPLNSLEEYMALVCYKNGSLTREDVRDRVDPSGGERSNKEKWAYFNQLLEEGQPGNDGKLGFFFKETEITPPNVRGFYRFHAQKLTSSSSPSESSSSFLFEDKERNQQWRVEYLAQPEVTFTPKEEARAVIEGQFLSMRLHAERIGITSFHNILATGGASANECVTRILAHVFGAAVFTAETANSASLGAAFRALHGFLCHEKETFIPFGKVTEQAVPFHQVHKREEEPFSLYSELLPVYAFCEQLIIDGRLSSLH